MPKETGEKLIVQNKKARHDYAIEDKYEAGLALTGTEVKSLREGRASLSEAFISIAAGVVCDCVYLLKGTEETADDE